MIQKTDNIWQGAFRAYGTALNRMFDNPLPLIAFTSVYFVVGVISRLTQGEYSYYSEKYLPLEEIVVLLFLLALFKYGLALADNKKVSIGDCLKFNLRSYIAILIATVLYIFIVFFSLLLLVLPLIWTIAWFYLFAYPISEKGLGPIRALKYSKQICSKNKSKVWGVVGVSLLLVVPAALISFIPFMSPIVNGIITFWTITAGAILYRWLEAQNLAAKNGGGLTN